MYLSYYYCTGMVTVAVRCPEVRSESLFFFHVLYFILVVDNKRSSIRFAWFKVLPVLIFMPQYFGDNGVQAERAKSIPF